ncbi:hypothetical protein [Bacillus sp. 1NLA3E]|nr:hypothetical protein [Bacillus sp. 1NLA3E]
MEGQRTIGLVRLPSMMTGTKHHRG